MGNSLRNKRRAQDLGVAQLVARYLGVVEAASSSLVTQTRKNRVFITRFFLYFTRVFSDFIAKNTYLFPPKILVVFAQKLAEIFDLVHTLVHTFKNPISKVSRGFRHYSRLKVPF